MTPSEKIIRRIVSESIEEWRSGGASLPGVFDDALKTAAERAGTSPERAWEIYSKGNPQ